jgi:hypothetical protein
MHILTSYIHHGLPCEFVLYSPFPTAFSCCSVVMENIIMNIPAHIAEQLSATWKD